MEGGTNLFLYISMANSWPLVRHDSGDVRLEERTELCFKVTFKRLLMPPSVFYMSRADNRHRGGFPLVRVRDSTS